MPPSKPPSNKPRKHRATMSPAKDFVNPKNVETRPRISELDNEPTRMWDGCE